jgi:hypothetical protein
MNLKKVTKHTSELSLPFIPKKLELFGRQINNLCVLKISYSKKLRQLCVSFEAPCPHPFNCCFLGVVLAFVLAVLALTDLQDHLATTKYRAVYLSVPVYSARRKSGTIN